MTYYKDITAEYEDIEDRYELMVERIRSITKEETVDMRYRDYFVRTGEFLLQLDKVIEKVKSGMPISESCTAGELQQINAALYQDVMPENYETSYCNYEYTRQMFGEKIAENEIEDIDKREYLFADYLTFLCYEFHGLIAAAFEGRVVDLTVWFELFVEVYGIFEDFPSVKAVKDAIYYFEHDYAEFFMDYRVREKMDPILSFATDIVMKCEDGDNSYLYEYGEYIGKNELETEAFLRRMSSEKVASIARTYTEGFRQGFAAAGIDMSKKKEIMTGRLENYVVVHGYASYDAFMNALETDPTGHMEKRLIGMLTTNHTFFMREFEHMEYLSRVVLPELSKKEAKTKDLGIWCAAASSGEEPYMLAMLIKDYFGLDHANWDTTILATDVSAEILEQATRGIYTADAIAPMPAQWKRRYFKACPDGLHYQVTDEIKKEILFRRFNLMSPFLFKHKFHIVFLRNVMIYFDNKTKQELIRKVYQCMEPGGYLFIGRTETIDRSVAPFQMIQPSIFRK